ncbi:MAG: PEP-CTERM sorting domain-containing protein [Synechococcaceae cyanobacterium SM2_3_1]|nr:PEP-CTERM sorting domain-containing protein [Synechococcaceae cyanobacterium SM2_3_1]
MSQIRSLTFLVTCVGFFPLMTNCGEEVTNTVEPEPTGPEQVVLVANTQGNNVVAYDAVTGGFLAEVIPPQAGGLLSPDTMVLGPDGNGDGVQDLYISSGNLPASLAGLGASSVLRYDGLTGNFIDIFVGDDPSTPDVDETGGLYRPYGIAFGPDGLLYVSSFLRDQILRYDANTGAFFDVFATGNQEPGGLNGPNSLLFDPNGALYVTTQGSVGVEGEPDFSLGLPSQVLAFNINTRESTVLLTPDPSPSSFGFVSLLGLALGPNGLLYVSDFANDILVVQPQTGALVDRLATNYTGTTPSSNFIGSVSVDNAGVLFTVGFNNQDAGDVGAILRFNGLTGEPFPAEGNSGALLTSPDPRLVRPIGVLVLEPFQDILSSAI